MEGICCCFGLFCLNPNEQADGGDFLPSLMLVLDFWPLLRWIGDEKMINSDWIDSNKQPSAGGSLYLFDFDGGHYARGFSTVDEEVCGLLERRGNVVSAGDRSSGKQRGDASEFGQRAGLGVKQEVGVVSFAESGGD